MLKNAIKNNDVSVFYTFYILKLIFKNKIYKIGRFSINCSKIVYNVIKELRYDQENYTYYHRYTYYHCSITVQFIYSLRKNFSLQFTFLLI